MPLGTITANGTFSGTISLGNVGLRNASLLDSHLKLSGARPRPSRH